MFIYYKFVDIVLRTFLVNVNIVLIIKGMIMVLSCN